VTTSWNICVGPVSENFLSLDDHETVLNLEYKLGQYKLAKQTQPNQRDTSINDPKRTNDS